MSPAEKNPHYTRTINEAQWAYNPASQCPGELGGVKSGRPSASAVCSALSYLPPLSAPASPLPLLSAQCLLVLPA